MPSDSARHRRRSVRLPAYDYAAPGLYFVTICTHGRAPLFGAVVDGAMRLNALGRLADEEWRRTAELRHEVALDVHVVMPNHVHLLFAIVGDDAHAPAGVGATRRVAPTARAHGPKPGSVVAWRINVLRGTPGAAVWQRNYHERIVRDDREATLIRRYVEENPLRWDLDRYHPGRG